MACYRKSRKPETYLEFLGRYPDLNRRKVAGQGVLVFTLLFCITAIPSGANTYNSVARAQSPKAKRPFRMLVLGDSVMWGQGLADEHKFSYKIGEWICAQRNGGVCQNKDDVQIHVEAHSGAVIAQPRKDDQIKEEERFTRIKSPVRYPGEVPSRHPTVWGEVDLARRYYLENSIPLSEVDLILVNGGINDMGPARILAPKPIEFLAGDVTKFAKKYCEADMKLLLDKVANTFPRARIVVPGYFPLVSISTPENIVSETIGYLFLGKKEKADEKGAMEEAPAKSPDANPSDAKPSDQGAAAPKLSSFLKNLAERSLDWTDSSNSAFAAAVKSFNSTHSGLPLAGNKIPSPAQRALFVAVPFGDDNAYAAKNAYLWRLIPKPADVVLECAGKDPFKKIISSDELQTKRPCMCDEAGKGNEIACLRAAAFHPNVAGADLYFRSITKELERILPFTGWAAK